MEQRDRGVHRSAHQLSDSDDSLRSFSEKYKLPNSSKMSDNLGIPVTVNTKNCGCS